MTKDEIIKLPDDELRILAAKLDGEKIVCERWPCGYVPDSCRLSAAPFTIKEKGGWATDTPKWYDMLWPVVPDYEEGWPPKYDNVDEDWVANVRPIKDYLNDIVAALALWNQIPEEKEVWWNDEGSVVSITWVWNEGWAYHLKGKPEELPRLLTQAFVIYKERQ